jgi:hypothetical protein
MINNKIKNKTYYAVGTIPKSNIKIANRGKTDETDVLTHKYISLAR